MPEIRYNKNGTKVNIKFNAPENTQFHNVIVERQSTLKINNIDRSDWILRLECEKVSNDDST